jgi:NAD(P)-dependent dehydrogenase (short-subunit alcohol dehydrogenase family)
MAMTDLFRLDGKVAAVTGGGRGIGMMIARGLLDAGATVYLSSRKTAEFGRGRRRVVRARAGAGHCG